MRAWFQETSENSLFFEAVKKPAKITYHQNAVVDYSVQKKYASMDTKMHDVGLSTLDWYTKRFRNNSTNLLSFNGTPRRYNRAYKVA